MRNLESPFARFSPPATTCKKLWTKLRWLAVVFTVLGVVSVSNLALRNAVAGSAEQHSIRAAHLSAISSDLDRSESNVDPKRLVPVHKDPVAGLLRAVKQLKKGMEA